jgi:hypothetical protein
MHETYKILRELENEKQLLVASYDELKRAEQLKESLNRHWPGNYFIQESVSATDVEQGLMHNYVFDIDPT